MSEVKDNLTIQSTRIFLRSLDQEDSERYRVLRNREENRKCFFSNTQISKTDQERWYRGYCENDDEFMFSIYEKSSGKYLGAVAIYHIDRQNRRAEVGRIIVDKSAASGKGYGKDAIQCIIAWGKERLGIMFFYAQIYADNLPSIKTFLRCGFVKRENDCKMQSGQQILVEKIIEK